MSRRLPRARADRGNPRASRQGRGLSGLALGARGACPAWSGSLAAAWQSARGRPLDPWSFTGYWLAVGVVALAGRLLGNRAGTTWRARRDTERRRSRQVIGQFLPALVAGAVATGALMRFEPGAGHAPARPVGSALRRRHLRGAAVRAARERLGRAVLLDGRAASCCGRPRASTRSRPGRSAARSASASCWPPPCCTGISNEEPRDDH